MWKMMQMLQMWILFSASKLVSVLVCVYLCLLTESLHSDDAILALSLASLIVRKPSRIEKPALNALPESEKDKDTLNICIHFYIYIQKAEITQPKSQSYDIVTVLQFVIFALLHQLSKVPHCALLKHWNCLYYKLRLNSKWTVQHTEQRTWWVHELLLVQVTGTFHGCFKFVKRCF